MVLRNDSSDQGFSPVRVFGLGILAVVFIFVLISLGKLFEHVAANEITVIQAPFSGQLDVYTTPGVKWQGFGTTTKYPKRSQSWFSSKEGQGHDVQAENPIKIRFNDGGHADVSGSVAWEMPVDRDHLILLHTKYGSTEAIAHQLVSTVVERSVYMAGPLMSSKESYAERRNELLQDIEDQIQNGIYLTQTTQIKQPDIMTGVEKTVNVVQPVRINGVVARADISPLKTFGIKTFNLSINDVKYDETVEKQIQTQQQATMEVQTAMAQARRAEQAAITAEKNGQAQAAQAKWEQEVIKAKEVTAAQQRLAVAQFDTQSAEQYKRTQILEGEGEAEKRKLVMAADGALEKKLAAYIEVQKFYADAIKNYQGNWVPGVVMGQGGASQNGAFTLLEMLGAKAAKDLAVDVAAPRQKP